MFTKNEIIDILKDNSQNDYLFYLADKTRKQFVGDEVHLRGLIEFSNICKCSCKYCGLNSFNKEIKRYRISQEEILKRVEFAVKNGYKTVVLQSGEDNFYSKNILCELIKEIKKYDIALTLSIGERSFEDYKAFKEAGANRFLLRIETTDRELYSRMHPNMSFENRVRCLKNLKQLGFETGSGCLVGLPGQTIESLAEDILFFKENDFDMIGIGPFISHPQTMLKDFPNGDFTLALKVMALVRLELPNINIPATTAMETLNPNGRIIALNSGANVVMPNITTDEYSSRYEIYPGKNQTKITRNQVEKMLKSIGRTISNDYGNRN